MAESRFKGLSILMNMRDVGIERTMKQIRAQFKTLDSEMRRSNANFKHSEKNMQSYATRTKELTKAIDVTENSMKDISNQLKKMTLEEQRSSVEAEKLRQEYSKQHRALQMYQRQLNSTEQEMKQFGTTTKQTIFSMKKINDVLGTMKRQLNIANMAFQSTEKSTSSYKNYLNQLNTVIQKHQNTIRVLEGRYQKVAREQGVMSKEALELKEKILQEKATLGQLDNQYKKTTMEAKRFAFEQKTLTASMSEIRQKMSQVSQSLTISTNKFKMSGQTAQAYKARISELNNGMKQQQLIVQNLSRQYDFAKKQYGATSQEAQQLNLKLSEERLKLKELNTQLNQTTQAHNRLEMEQKQGISSMAQIRAKMSQFNDTLSLSRSNLARAGESVKAYGNHLNTLKTNMSEQRVVLRELIAQYNHVATAQGRDSQEARELSSAITQQKIKMNELESELDQTTQSYKRLEIEQRNAQRLSSTGFGRGVQNVNKYKDSINSVGSSMRNVGSNMSLYFTLPVVAGFGAAIKTGADFEQQMARVGAIAGSSKSDLKSLSDQAVDLGAKTSLSASEVAKGMEELAALGMNTNQIMKAMPGVISAAEASGSDLATTATIMASSLNSFNLKASDSSHVADVLATAANDSAADVQYMGDALKYAGTPAHALGITLEDTSAAIEVMSNSGLEGSQAGTALRASFIRLAKPTKASQKAMDELGVSLTNSKGQFVGMPNLIGQFKSSLQGMTKEQKLAYVSQIVGTEAASGFLALIDAGPSKIKKYSDSLKDSNGASKEAADKMKDNLKGSLEQLHGAFESLGITIGKAFSPALRKLADIVTAVVSKFSSLPTPVIVITTLFVGLVASIGPLLMLTGLLAHSIVGISEAMTLLNATKGGAKFFSLFNGGIKGVLPKIGQLLTKIPLLGSAFTLLTGPVGIVIGVIAALTAGIVYLWKTNDSFRNFVINAWNAIKNSAIAVFGFIKPYIINIWNAIKNSSIAIWNALKNAAKVTWNAIKFAVQHPIQALKNIISGIWNFIKTNSLNTWNLIKTGILNIVKSLVSLVRASFNGLKAFFTMLWSFIKNNSIKAWLAIKNSVLAIIRNFVTLSKHNFAVLKGFLSALWTSIKNTAIKLWTALKTGVLTIIRVLVSTARSILNTLKNFITRLWRSIKAISIRTWTAIKNGVINAIKGMYNGVRKILANLKAFIIRTWNAIKNTTVKLAKGLSTGVKNAFNSLSRVTRNIFNKLKAFMSNVWRSIKNTTIKLAKGLWSGVKAIWNALSRFTRSVFNKLKNFMSSVWRNIKNTTVRLAKALWSGVKNTWNSLSKGTHRIFNSVKSYMNRTWNSIKNNTIKLSKALWSGVKRNWNSLKSGTVHLFNSVKNYMSRTWNSIKNNTIKLARLLWSGVKRNWNSLKSGTSAIFSRVKNDTVSKWKSMKNSMVSISSALWSKVKSTFNNMAGGLKSIIGRIKGHITGMVDAVKSGLNKLIKGVNWVAKKLDMDPIPSIKLSTGTESTHTQSYITKGKLNRNTLATVGDKGPGNGPGGFRHETVIPPNGKAFITPATDTTIPLAKGTRILNGAQTHTMLSNNMIPKFSIGTKLKDFAMNTFDSGKKAIKGGIDKVKDAGGTVKNTVKNTAAKGIAKGIEITEKAKDVGSAVIKGIGDVFDYIGHPGKLVNKIFEKVGFNFDFLKGAELPYMLMQGAYKKLKNGVKSLFDGWLNDAGGGDGSSFTGYHINTGYYPNGGAPGYGFAGGHHYGIDFGTPYGTTINSTNDGNLKEIHNFGGGLVARLLTGQFTLFFMHLSKILKHGKVKAGEPIAKTGNSGNWTTGPHLHLQVEKGRHDTITNANTVNPLKWLKGHAKSGGSAPKAGIKWAPQIKQALRMNGLPTSSAYVNAWARQIDSESSGNPRAVQGGYVDANTGGNEAKGLVQVARNTFNSMKFPGHGNVFNPLDNLLAGIHWAKYKYGKNMLSVIGHGHGYATGGLIKSAGWYNIAEGGYPEWIIPTDPSRRNDAMKMLALAAQDIDRKSSTRGNKRPNNLKSPNNLYSNNNDELLLQMIEQQQQQINLLMEIARSNRGIENKEMEVNLDGKSLNKNNNKHQALNNATRLMGGR
ncbi:phage tail tape measure protein [Staphylococcus hominis]|uniref:phage tail tape measure protein n=1 Tax=Staphylococcus hominis TaxID=1290 RepID=UPI0034CECA7F